VYQTWRSVIRERVANHSYGWRYLKSSRERGPPEIKHFNTQSVGKCPWIFPPDDSSSCWMNSLLHSQIGTHAQGASLASLGKDINKNPRRRQGLAAQAAGVSCHLKCVGTEPAAGPPGQVRGRRALIHSHNGCCSVAVDSLCCIATCSHPTCAADRHPYGISLLDTWNLWPFAFPLFKLVM